MLPTALLRAACLLIFFMDSPDSGCGDCVGDFSLSVGKPLENKGEAVQSASSVLARGLRANLRQRCKRAGGQNRRNTVSIGVCCCVVFHGRFDGSHCVMAQNNSSFRFHN